MSARVTELIVQRRNPDRVNVYLDGDFAFGLYRITAAWLRIGQELTTEEIKALKDKDVGEVVYQSALRLLNYRQRTSNEMTDRLIKKGYDPEEVQSVIDRLQQNHLLDDRQFAEAWINDRKSFHPRSKRLLVYEMQNKGLDRQIIQDVMEGIDDDPPLAEAAARKALHRWMDLAEKEFVTRCAAFLSRKGFAAGLCFSTARKLWAELQLEMEQ